MLDLPYLQSHQDLGLHNGSRSSGQPVLTALQGGSCYKTSSLLLVPILKSLEEHRLPENPFLHLFPWGAVSCGSGYSAGLGEPLQATFPLPMVSSAGTAVSVVWLTPASLKPAGHLLFMGYFHVQTLTQPGQPTAEQGLGTDLCTLKCVTLYLHLPQEKG